MRTDAKSELKRLLAKHGDKLSAATQARLAEAISLDDARRFKDWNGWDEADAALLGAMRAAALI